MVLDLDTDGHDAYAAFGVAASGESVELNTALTGVWVEPALALSGEVLVLSLVLAEDELTGSLDLGIQISDCLLQPH
ncbi:MAG: hypothetical protein ABMB14_09795 [Myxococcota bacterium]